MIYLADGYFYVNGQFQWGALQLDGPRIGAFQPIDPDIHFEPPLWDPLAKTMHLGGKYVLPGLIDVHVHFRDMDQKEKETIETGSRAALHSGVTTVVNMPNTRPPATTPDVVAAWQILALKNCYVNVAFLSGVPPLSRRAALNELVEKPIKGFKIYLYAALQPENAWHQPEVLKKFLAFAQEKNQLVCFHSDTFQPEGVRKQRYECSVLEGKSELEAHNETYPKQEEINAIRYILEQYKTLGNTHPIHFCHVSTPEAINRLLDAKREGLNASWEVTPHHMFLSMKDHFNQASFAKVLVPLRSEEARDGVFRHVAEGNVPIIATDHSPHTLKEKNQDFYKSPAGIPGVELLGPLILTEIFEGRLTEKILECITSNPAERFNFTNKGRILPGYDADIAIFEKVDPYSIDPTVCFTKAKFSPYEQRALRARVTDVFLGGEFVLYQGTERLGPSGTVIS